MPAEDERRFNPHDHKKSSGEQGLAERLPREETLHMAETVQARHKIEMWHRDRIKVVGNVRKTFDEEELRRLGRSYKKRWIMPLLALPDGTLIDGERRFRGGCLEGMEQFPVQVVGGVLRDGEIAEMQLISAVHRADLSGWEKYQAVKEMMRLDTKLTNKDLAERLDLDPSYLTRLLSPDNCIPPVQEAFMQDAIGIKAVYELSKARPEEQAALLAIKLAGGNDAEIARGRKRRNGSTSAAPRMPKVTVAMPGGARVVISGKDLGMDEVVELLSETLKEAKKAASMYDIKTFASMMKDRAKG